MSYKSKIEWCESTWNPVRAKNIETGGRGHFCIHVSPGCKKCYAERMQKRFNNPVRFAAQDFDKVELELDEDVLMQPLRWKKPRMVFPCSMTDLFLEHHPEEWIDKIFAVMALCPQHTFQVLTKRTLRAYDYLTSIDNNEGDGRRLVGDDWRTALIEGTAQRLWYDRTGEDPSMWLAVNMPLKNVWIGTSAEDQQRFDERIEPLRLLPAAVRFLSLEPLLGSIRITKPVVDWVIVGGESGPGARPMHPQWAHDLRDQCVDMGIPYFFKQWGHWAPMPIDDAIRAGRSGYYMKSDGSNALGTDMRAMAKMSVSEIAERACPPDVRYMAAVGKKAAGRMLDGRTWDQMPERVFK